MKNVLLSTAAIGTLILLSAGVAQAQTVTARQEATATVESSEILESGDFLDARRGITRNGDIRYGEDSFDTTGVVTLQNETGILDANNNAAQIVAADEDSSIVSRQILSASVANATVDVENIADNIPNGNTRTGDIRFGAGSFGGRGVFTVQNQTGLLNASNNATSIVAQF